MNRARDRLAGATIAVMLQLGFVTVFIYSLPLIVPVKRRAQEITFFLPHLRDAAKPVPGPARARPSRLPPPATPPSILPPLAVPPVAAPPESDLRAFGRQLFGCAPENRNTLTPDERARCSGFARVPRDRDRVGEPPSLVKDPARRAAELAARNTPARVALAGVCSGMSAPARAGMPMKNMAMTDMPMTGMPMAGVNDMAMPCGQHAPAHKAPCERQCCSCVLGAAALAGGPLAVASLALPTFRSSWPLTLRPDGRTQKPALPPPRA
jgi:hypothetical protein